MFLWLHRALLFRSDFSWRVRSDATKPKGAPLLRRADNEVHELHVPDLHDNQRPLSHCFACRQSGLLSFGFSRTQNGRRCRYVQVSAGDFHVVWLRSDGTVVAAGDNRYGQWSPKMCAWFASVPKGFEARQRRCVQRWELVTPTTRQSCSGFVRLQMQ